MTDPYVTFDTFSLGDSAAEPAPAPAPPRPSLLAKLPRVAPTQSRPKPIQRYDGAESPLHGVHLGEMGADLAMAGSATGAGPVARRPMPSNPAATIRIDTVSPTTFDDEQPVARRPALAKPVAISDATATDVVVDDPWAAWLLNLESTIVPYSRVIVLAAVIAAMGLTVVLLRGGAKPVEAPSPGPQVSTDDAGDSLVATDVFGAPPSTSANLWAAPTAKTEADLRPINVPTTTAPVNSFPVAAAVGPASAKWHGAAGAKLTGQVLPVDDTRVEVAEVPAFPPTTTR
jgi:hypothetical protein